MNDALLDRIQAVGYSVPTERPESDGTLQWDSTGVVVVHVSAGDVTGVGWSYAHPAAALIVDELVAPATLGHGAMDVPGLWQRAWSAIRNQRQGGLAAMAVSAFDVAAWDLKARLMEVSLVSLLGRVRESMPAYGSGGFTSCSVDELCDQLAGWREQGVVAVKMKVGRAPLDDPRRVAAARDAIGPDVSLYVDANEAWSARQAVRTIHELWSESGIERAEEPVGSDDLRGLRFVRDNVPPGVAVTAGEYGDSSREFRRMLDAGAVDVLQADVTRCGGITGLARAAAIAGSFGVPVSAHTAPTIHAHVGCALQEMVDVEWFHDHVRIERELLDGAVELERGLLTPDPARPGLGVELRTDDAAPYEMLRREKTFTR